MPASWHGLCFLFSCFFLSISLLLDWIFVSAVNREERFKLERLLQEISLFLGFNKEQPYIFLQTTGFEGVFLFHFSIGWEMLDLVNWDFATLTCTLRITFCSVCFYFLLQTSSTCQIWWLHFVRWRMITNLEYFMLCAHPSARALIIFLMK